MVTLKLKALWAILLLAALLSSARAQERAIASTVQDADALFEAQQWAEAAGAYEVMTKAEPGNGRAWMRLGYSRQSLGKFEQALDAFQHALEIGKGTPRAAVSMYALASTYALMKKKEKAFEWLNQALNAGLPQPRQIRTDPNLANLRDDPRFQAVLAVADKASRVCMNIPEYRQFDFWVGDWNVLDPHGQQVGANKVVLLEDGCIVEENWTSASGETGKSFNFYNPITRTWHQSYMDSGGNNWMMDGQYKDGALRYEGAIYSPKARVMVRMTFFNLGPDKVRQTAETSADNGQTWTPVWDGLYIRKK